MKFEWPVWLHAMRQFLSSWEPTLWAMAFRACFTPIAHRVGSYKKTIPEMLFKTSACRIDRVISWFCRLGAAGLRCV